MAKDNAFDEMQAHWLSLVDRYSRFPSPPMLNVGQRKDLQKLIEEMGPRLPAYLTWCCENWQRCTRRLADLHVIAPGDPRLGLLLDHIDPLAGMAGDAHAYGYSPKPREATAEELATYTGPSGNGSVLIGGEASIEQAADAALAAQKGV